MNHALAALLVLAAVGASAGAEAAFWVPPALGANVSPRVVVVGDSIAAGNLDDDVYTPRPYAVVLRELLSPRHPGVEIVNEGIPGLDVGGLLGLLPDILDANQPIAVLIMIGTNDASKEHAPGDIVDSIRQLVQIAKARGVIPIVATVPPNYRPFGAPAEAIVEAVNAQLPGVAAAEEVRLVDVFTPLDDAAFFPDGLHPSEAGHAVMAAVWHPAVDAALDDALTLLPQAYVLRFNAETFRSGERLQVDLTLGDSVTSGVVDVYFGLFLPPEAGPLVGCPVGEALAFLADDFTRLVLTCLEDVAAEAVPLRANVEFVSPTPLITVGDFWATVFLPEFPLGEYGVFFALTAAGSPTDVLVRATHAFTLAP
ncbi:MAG: SGNH/GDSL hydrolase family protein [Candidatus Rokuibacteriota bacterium]